MSVGLQSLHEFCKAKVTLGNPSYSIPGFTFLIAALIIDHNYAKFETDLEENKIIKWDY